MKNYYMYLIKRYKKPNGEIVDKPIKMVSAEEKIKMNEWLKDYLNISYSEADSSEREEAYGNIFGWPELNIIEEEGEIIDAFLDYGYVYNIETPKE